MENRIVLALASLLNTLFPKSGHFWFVHHPKLPKATTFSKPISRYNNTYSTLMASSSYEPKDAGYM